MDSQLRQISTLVQERRYDEARAALQPYLREHPEAANGWYLLSFAAATPAAKKQAIQKALQLAPDNEKYVARAAKLSASAPRSMKMPLLIGGLVVIAVLAVLFEMLRPALTPDPTALPTLAVSSMSSPTPGETAQVVIHISPTPNVINPSPTTAMTQTLPPTVVVTQSTQESTTSPTFTVNQTVEIGNLLAAPTAQFTAALPTAGSSQNTTPQPTDFLPQVPTSTPSQTPQPGEITATPILTGDAGVPVSTPLDIGTGSMRVVGVTRPGSSFITEMGGQAADLPAGQDWVVLESIVICSGSSNCAPALSNLHVVSASGATYAPAPDFSMPQLFGPGAFALGQVWGYMGFRVPTSESGLRLVLSQGDKTYTFALQ